MPARGKHGRTPGRRILVEDTAPGCEKLKCASRPAGAACGLKLLVLNVGLYPTEELMAEPLHRQPPGPALTHECLDPHFKEIAEVSGGAD